MTENRDPSGIEILQDPARNKSTAFTAEERERLGLRGLLPAVVCSQDTQVERVLRNIRRKASDIERYIFLRALHARNERLFYRVVLEHIEEMLPIVYTPTVGQAAREFAHIFRQTRGFYLTPQDGGEMRRLLGNWPNRDVRVIVVTDGERILGLGDLGANGMAIPIGKLALYTACAGIGPEHCLPVMLDVGTNNEALRADPLYLGIPARRLTREAYLACVDEFVAAVTDAFPDVLIQFEDFATANAVKLLERYRTQALCFNDDIQGTAAVALAGIYASLRISGLEMSDLRVVFLGAGSANSGIAALLVEALVEAGLAREAARERIWFVDVDGLITTRRADLPPHLRAYARAGDALDFLATLRTAAPQILIGATGAHGSFSEDAVRLMAELNERPVIFALSNPTSVAECTAEQAYGWSDGRAIFAGGSPFAPVELRGRLHRCGQANNVYVFPGIGRGAVVSRARRLPEAAFLAAARAVAQHVDETALTAGTIYPPLTQVREVSLAVASAVARTVFAAGLARAVEPTDIDAAVRAGVYDAHY